MKIQSFILYEEILVEDHPLILVKLLNYSSNIACQASLQKQNEVRMTQITPCGINLELK